MTMLSTAGDTAADTRRTTGSAAASSLRRRPLFRRVMHIIRRTHLYTGLFLAPWAALYGITGLLFNHPTFLADNVTAAYTRDDLVGTSMENAPGPEEHARAVVAALNAQQKGGTPWRFLDEMAQWGTRDSFIATVKADRRSFFVTFDPRTASGVIRETTPPSALREPAPFATGTVEPPRQRGMGMMGPMKKDPGGIAIGDSIVERLKESIPALMERHGLPKGEVVVTAAPDVKFVIEGAGQLWTVTYNPLTTSVSGEPGTGHTDLSWRSFLLRMHLTRGYPGELSTKWVWALGVDAIGMALCFWSLSGLLMWWQIKATRKPGLLLLAGSGAAASALSIAMHQLLTV